MGKKNRNRQINQVAQETGVATSELEKLNDESLQALDELEDDEDLLGSDDSEESKSDDVPELPSDEISADSEGVESAGLESSGSEGNEGDGGETVETEQPPVPTEEQSGSIGPGTQVLGEVAGGEIRPSETPQPPSKVETQEGQGSVGQVLPSGKGADAVVEEKFPHRVWKQDEKPEGYLGLHPMTGTPVFIDEQ